MENLNRVESNAAFKSAAGAAHQRHRMDVRAQSTLDPGRRPAFRD